MVVLRDGGCEAAVPTPIALLPPPLRCRCAWAGEPVGAGAVMEVHSMRAEVITIMHAWCRGPSM